MKELLRTARLALYVLVLPLVATAGVSAYQWTSPQDLDIDIHSVSYVPPKATFAPIRRHAIQLDQQGAFIGKVWVADPKKESQFGAASLDVTLFQEGKPIYRTQTSLDGTFRIGNVAPGVYALVARGHSVISIHAIQISGKRRK